MRRLSTTPLRIIVAFAKGHIPMALVRKTPLARGALIFGILGILLPVTLHTQELTAAQAFTSRAAAHQEIIAPPVSEVQKKDYIVHVVQRGNTISKIARSYGTTIDAILAMNNLSVDDVLAIKQKLAVPAEGKITISWYGSWFNNKLMANAEPYHTNKLVIAHRYLPLGTCVELSNPNNGERIVAVVKDRIAERYSYRWDVSPRVFNDGLGISLTQGIARVKYKIVDCADGLLAYAR